MQPVRKKSAKRFPRALWLLPLVIAMGVFLFIILNQPKTGLPEHHHEESISLINIPQEELLSFEVFPRRHSSFTLIQSEEGFVVNGAENFQLDEIQLSLMIKDLTVLVANELAGEVHTDEENLALLGLGQEAARVTARYTNDRSITLVFGNSAQTEIPSDYIMVEGENKVYTISQETRDHFDRSLESLHPLPAINFNADLVQQVEVTGKDGFLLQQEEGLWDLTSPIQYPADNQAITDLLNSIGKMRFAVYAGEAKAENLERFGFHDDSRQITFYLSSSVITGFDKEGIAISSQQVPQQSISIKLGENIDNIGLYCLYNGGIYQATNLSMGFLRDMDVFNLLSPNPFTLPINRVKSLIVKQNGETKEYDIELIESVLPNNQIAQDEDGNTLYEPYVTLDGQEIPQEGFIHQYLQLMQLQRVGRLPENYQPSGEASLIIQLNTYRDKKLEVAFYPFDALHYAMQVNGTFIDYLPRANVDKVGL